MYTCQKYGGPFWKVCEDDGTVLNTFRSKVAATRYMRDMKAAIRYDEQSDSDAKFLAIHGPDLNGS